MLFLNSYVCPTQTTRRRLILQCVCFLEMISLKKVCASSFWCRPRLTSSYLFSILSFFQIPQTQKKNPNSFSVSSFLRLLHPSHRSRRSSSSMPPPLPLLPPPLPSSLLLLLPIHCCSSSSTLSRRPSPFFLQALLLPRHCHSFSSRYAHIDKLID
ncbi:hypothetical protein Hanom_Chr12g01144471 [Helianthus anomalus]